MLAITTIIFGIVPIISIPLLILGICCSEKYRMVYLIYFAFILGIIAYYWVPPIDFDLYRYHIALDNFKKINFNTFWEIYGSKKEIISNLLFYIVSKFENNNLLQFITTFIGYGIIFYIISDYCKQKKYSNIIFVISFLYVVASLRYLNFISGIRNTLAVIIFGLGIYLEYVKKGKKIICNLIYISTIFIHISSLLLVALKLVYTYIFKEKIDIKNIIITAIIFLSPQILLTIITKISNIAIFSNLNNMYISYFINGSTYEALTGGSILYLNIIKATFCLLIVYILRYKCNEKENKINNFILLLVVVLLAITVQSKEFIKRFIFLAELLNSLIIMDCYSKSTKNIKLILIFGVLMFSILMLYLQIKGYITLNFGNLFSNNIANNIFTIFKK